MMTTATKRMATATAALLLLLSASADAEAARSPAHLARLLAARSSQRASARAPVKEEGCCTWNPSEGCQGEPDGWCQVNSGRCEGNCGGEWLTPAELEELQKQAEQEVAAGCCTWDPEAGCQGEPDGWCQKSKGRCEGSCGGEWLSGVDSQLRIAVIGGGPAGLFAARELKLLGYDNVVVFEASAAPGGTVRSIEASLGVHDMSTNFVPMASFLGGKPRIVELFEEYGVELAPMPKFAYLAPTPKGIVQLPGPHVFMGMTDKEILGGLLYAWDLLREAATFETTLECEAVYGNDQTWKQFTLATEHKAFAYLAAFMTDAMLSGPSMERPVCYTLMLRADWMAATIAAVLHQGGLPPLPFLDEPLQELLKTPEIQNGQIRNYCPAGYQRFFDALVDKEGLNVRHRARVSKLQQNGNGKVKVWLNGDENTTGGNGKFEKFDKVVVAAKPSAARSFLPWSHPMKQLYGKVKTGVCESSLVKFDSSKAPLEAPFAAALYPQAGALGGENLAQLANGLPLGVQSLKGYGEDHLVAIAYAAEDLPPEASQEALKYGLAQMGFGAKETIYSERFEYPATISRWASKQGWHADADAAQGEQNMFFVGEALAGPSVPAQLDFAAHYIPKWFEPLSGATPGAKRSSSRDRAGPARKRTREEEEELMATPWVDPYRAAEAEVMGAEWAKVVELSSDEDVSSRGRGRGEEAAPSRARSDARGR